MSDVTELLTQEQADALSVRARARNRTLEDELRLAVDCYLAGITLDELETLDLLSRKAQEDISAMNAAFDRINEKAADVFAQLDERRRVREQADMVSAMIDDVRVQESASPPSRGSATKPGESR